MGNLGVDWRSRYLRRAERSIGLILTTTGPHGENGNPMVKKSKKVAYAIIYWAVLGNDAALGDGIYGTVLLTK